VSPPEELTLKLKGLVYVRALLESRGATHAEISVHTEEIRRVRAQLAQFVGAERGH
jgi:hypothetical protein